MAKYIITFIILILIHWPVLSQTIWGGPKITFTKANNADFNAQENQDRITDAVWITRGTTQGIFNIKTESSYVLNSSPSDTEWAFGTTADLPGLTFDNWQTTVESNPPAMVDRDMVLHLISEDIYIDLKFLSWSVGTAGGGFSYERSTAMPSGTVNDESFSVSLSVFPNPGASGMAMLRYESDSSEPADVSVFSLAGKLHFDKTLPVHTGINDWALDLSALKPGIYLILFRQGSRQAARKIALE